jgi:integrase
MARLGNPVEGPAVQSLTLGQLADRFGEWMAREVAAGRLRPRTLAYYRDQLQRFLDAVGGHRAAASVKPHELETYKTGWHSVQAVQRLFNWGVQVGHLAVNPVRSVALPEAGRRQRVLSAADTARLLRAADRHFRPFLLAMRHTIARPQEVRALRWKHLTYEPVPMFVLRDFKGRRRRGDRQTAARTIPLDDRMLRLLARLARRRNPSPEDHVFLNRRGLPWTGNAVRCRMMRLRGRAKLEPDGNGERVVCYTLRHTAATRASARGVRDRVLAELMGHTNTTTTQRYQHLQADHLAEAIRQANRRRNQ